MSNVYNHLKYFYHQYFVYTIKGQTYVDRGERIKYKSKASFSSDFHNSNLFSEHLETHCTLEL